MKLKAKLLCYSAAILMTTSVAFAAIDGNALADDYLAQGYTFAEVKVGPTQTKVEAIKGDMKVEVIYDNETAEILKSEQKSVESDDASRVGKQVGTVNRDFEGSDDEGRDKHDDDNDDHDGKGRGGDDDHGDDHGGDSDGHDDNDNGSDDD